MEVSAGATYTTHKRDGQFCPTALTKQFVRFLDVHRSPELKCLDIPQPSTVVSIKEKKITSARAYPFEWRGRTRDQVKADGIIWK